MPHLEQGYLTYKVGWLGRGLRILVRPAAMGAQVSTEIPPAFFSIPLTPFPFRFVLTSIGYDVDVTCIYTATVTSKATI